VANDLNKRIQRTASKGRAAQPAAKERAFIEAPKRYSKRFTLDLEEGDFKALKMDGIEAGVPVAEILRGLVAVYREDETLKKEAVRRAQEERGRD
jgi:hypothetical protein